MHTINNFFLYCLFTQLRSHCETDGLPYCDTYQVKLHCPQQGSTLVLQQYLEICYTGYLLYGIATTLLNDGFLLHSTVRYLWTRHIWYFWSFERPYSFCGNVTSSTGSRRIANDKYLWWTGFPTTRLFGTAIIPFYSTFVTDFDGAMVCGQHKGGYWACAHGCLRKTSVSLGTRLESVHTNFKPGLTNTCSPRPWGVSSYLLAIDM